MNKWHKLLLSNKVQQSLVVLLSGLLVWLLVLLLDLETPSITAIIVLVLSSLVAGSLIMLLLTKSRNQERSLHEIVKRQERQIAETTKRLDDNEAHHKQILEECERTHVAERIRLREEAENLEEKLQNANRIKQAFLANITHEIRTPMNAIAGLSNLLTRTELSTMQKEYVDSISRATETLLNIINDILDASSIEKGSVKLDKTLFDMEKVLHDALDIARNKAERKALVVELKQDPRTPTVVIGDPGRLQQVLMNLLDNAVKFTNRGEIVLSVQLRELKAREHRVVLDFSVRDTGIGISRDAMSKLFRTFNHSDANASKSLGGTGLGLAICKRLVELMEGAFRIDSEPGRGSVFSFDALFNLPTKQDAVETRSHEISESTRMRLLDSTRGKTLLSLLPEELPGIDIVTALRRMQGNQQLLRRLIIMFRSQNQDTLTRAHNALKNGKTQEAEYLIHSMKGAAANIAACELENAAQDLVTALRKQESERYDVLLTLLDKKMRPVLLASTILEKSYMFDEEDTIRCGNNHVMVDAVRPIMAKVMHYLRQHHLNARKGTDMLCAQFSGSYHAVDFRKVHKAVKALDYEHALDHLEHLAVILELEPTSLTIEGAELVAKEAQKQAESRARILVVDDVPANIELVDQILTADYDVFFSCTGAESLQIARRELPDLVLLDIMMPGMDGYEVCHRLREMPDTAGIPVIFLTARTQAVDVIQGFLTGGVDYVTKPFQPEELVARTRTHIQLKRNNEKLERMLRELRETQQQLVRQERLGALGQMARGIAHNFNNALQPILFSAGMLNGNPMILGHKEAGEKVIQDILNATRSAAKTVKRLINFYRSAGRADKMPVDVQEVAVAVIEATRASWQDNALLSGKYIQLLREITPDVSVHGVYEEIREIFLNLILNAIAAISENGNIIIRVSKEAPFALIEVEDDGVGMSEEVKSRCFEPFYSTDVQCGRGLGLSSVFGIVKRHDGRIEVDSKVGCGTCMRVYLPLDKTAPKHRGTPVTRNEEHIPDLKDLRLLWIDDDPLTSTSIADVLREYGMQVTAVSTGGEAWEQFKASEFDLVITDYALPEIGGLQLARQMKERNLKTPIIILTAFGHIVTAHKEYPRYIDLLLHKPITAELLMHSISAVMHRRGGMEEGAQWFDNFETAEE